MRARVPYDDIADGRVSQVAGFSTIYRWAPVKRGDVRGLVNHHARDVDRANGREVSHSNEGIVGARTDLNVTVVNDGAGNFVPCTDSNQWTEYLDSRLEDVGHTFRTQKDGSRTPVALRKDAAVAVDYLLQLDPEFTGTIEDASVEQLGRTAELLQKMVDEVVEQHGAENVVGWTLHMDEKNPHVQLMALPVTPEGATSYKQFFGDAEPGKRSTKAGSMKAYAARHDSMRSKLRESGYEATFERVNEGREHVPLAKYKTSKDKAREAEEQMAAREIEAEEQRQRLVKARDVLEERRTGLLNGVAALEASEKRRQEIAEAERKAIQKERLEVSRALSEARETLEKAQELLDDAVVVGRGPDLLRASFRHGVAAGAAASTQFVPVERRAEQGVAVREVGQKAPSGPELRQRIEAAQEKAGQGDGGRREQLRARINQAASRLQAGESREGLQRD